MNSKASIPFADQLQQLINDKKACPSSHPFLKAFGLTGNQHSQVTACLDGFEYPDCYLRAVRSPAGDYVNAVLFKEQKPGAFEQIFVGSAFKLGYYCAAGKLTDGQPIYVTVDLPSASHLAVATGAGAVAALHPQNLEAVTLAIRSEHPNSELLLALDWKDSGSGQDSRSLQLVRELSSKLAVPYATSGDEASFVELAQVRGKGAVAKRLESAEVPPEHSALSGVTTSSPIPEAAISATFPQNGAGLLRDVVAAVRRAVVTSEAAAMAIALWIIFTHVYRSFTIAPLLVLSSPDKRCGKTNAITLLLRLVASPLATSNVTEAVIYRSVELWQPTLLIDEADTFMIGNKRMAGIINSGYTLAAGRVLRNSRHGVESMNTFVPKAIAVIGTLSDTVMDRAVHVRLARKHPSEEALKVQPHGPDGFTILQARIIRWANDHRDELTSIDVPRIEGIDDRANDNAAPLLAIAAACGDLWVERASAALKELAAPADQSLSVSTQLLADIRHAFKESQQEQMPTAELLRHLHGNDESLWPTHSRGGPMTARDMAELLGRYGIKSFSMRKGEQVVRAYARHQFLDAFKRYLS